MCGYHHTAALTAARARPEEAAREVGDDLKAGWALAHEAGALHRPGRNDEPGARRREAPAHLGNQTRAQSRLAEQLRHAPSHFEAARMPARSEPSRLDLGILLRHLGRSQEARETPTAAHEALVQPNTPARLRHPPDGHHRGAGPLRAHGCVGSPAGSH